jgi:RNA polymerase sigma-70 factor, ECF subfamily
MRGDRLIELLYDELRVCARGILAGEHDQRSLDSAGLVHAAYLELMKSGRVNVSDRSHFLNLAAQVMRRIIIDRARARGAKKRDGEYRFFARG